MSPVPKLDAHPEQYTEGQPTNPRNSVATPNKVVVNFSWSHGYLDILGQSVLPPRGADCGGSGLRTGHLIQLFSKAGPASMGFRI